MLKLFIIAILLINSIFWGFYPKTSTSPHQRIINKLGIHTSIPSLFHLCIGLFFYLIAFLVSHGFIS
jgi:hypothetical protein